MFSLCAFALLCLIAVSDAGPLDCKELMQPLDQLNPRDYEGRWAMIASSLKVIESAAPVKLSDSISIDFYNSTFYKTHRFGESCSYTAHNVSIEGPHYNFTIGQVYHFSGTIYKTTCEDCVVLSFNVDSPNHKTEELCLFSRRREVDQMEMRKFTAQVECLKMPEYTVMDPTKELCPVPICLHKSD